VEQPGTTTRSDLSIADNRAISSAIEFTVLEGLVDLESVILEDQEDDELRFEMLIPLDRCRDFLEVLNSYRNPDLTEFAHGPPGSPLKGPRRGSAAPSRPRRTGTSPSARTHTGREGSAR
jgi:hypothetical protein